MDKPNQHDGPCWKCGTKVPARTGTYSREHHRSEHPEGACKTTTKTWRDYQAAKALRDFQAENAKIIADAGYTVTPGFGFEQPTRYAGNGLIALVGGSPRNEIRQYGVRIFRAARVLDESQMLAEYPRPVYPPAGTGWDAHLEMTKALIALIDAHKGA